LITKAESIAPGETLSSDICIVGGGAAGISVALELGKTGMQVILLEAGGMKWDKGCQELYTGKVLDPSTHAPLDSYRHRRLGGTTTVWGGRCVPFDNIDFEKREHVPFSGWPISLKDLEPHYARAQQYCECGQYNYNVHEAIPDAPADLIPGFQDGEVVTSRLERFSPPTDFGKAFYAQLKHSDNIKVLLNANVLAINLSEEGTRATTLEVSSRRKGRFTINARAFVLAAGGLEITRLLLASNRVQKNGIGNHSGLLGRYYMSHLSGKISQIKIAGDPDEVVYGYERDAQGVYCRRRFNVSERAQRQFQILNFAAWLDNAPIHDPSHRHGALSLAFLLNNIAAVRKRIAPENNKFLAMGGTGRNLNLAHMKNVMKGIPQIAALVPAFARDRYLGRRRIPSLILKSPANIYSIHYHVEQSPNPDSRVRLSGECDTLGMPRLVVDYRVNDLDVQSIQRAHILIDRQLREQGCGSLAFYKETEQDVLAHIREQIGVGGHHIGTTRMSREPAHGVVDLECRIHGMSNLFVASSSVFPTSSQANPTLTIVAFGARIASYISRNLEKLDGAFVLSRDTFFSAPASDKARIRAIPSSPPRRLNV
jgi:choline dehydrogenase-like flavoprotein